MYCCLGKVKRLLLALVIFAVSGLLMSCMDFFSTSLAAWAARDPNRLIPAVTAGNVDELVATAENNPDLSLAVLKKIQSAAGTASGDDKVKLQTAALGAAVNAAGLGQAVFNAAGAITSITDADNPQEKARQMVLDALNSMNNLEAAGSVLFDTLPKPGDPDFSNFTDSASANDLAMAAAVLLAGEVKKNSGGDLEGYVDKLLDNTYTPTDPENLAMKLAQASLAQGNLSGPLQDLLSGLNLIT